MRANIDNDLPPLKRKALHVNLSQSFWLRAFGLNVILKAFEGSKAVFVHESSVAQDGTTCEQNSCTMHGPLSSTCKCTGWHGIRRIELRLLRFIRAGAATARWKPSRPHLVRLVLKLVPKLGKRHNLAMCQQRPQQCIKEHLVVRDPLMRARWAS